MSAKRLGAMASLAVLLASALVLLAACGGSDDPGVAEASGEGAATTAQTSTSPAAQDGEQAQLDFARCMREQGLDFPDPQPDENGDLRFQPPEGGLDDPGAFQDAAEECQEFLAGAQPQLNEEDRSELQDAQLEFARCMRDEGVDVADPQPGQVGPGALGELDADDPAVQEALEACQSVIQDALPATGGD